MDEALVTLPASAEGHALDLTDEQAVKAFFAGLGAFDHLAFTAGETLQLCRLSETDIAAARAFFGLRYWGAYMAAKYGSSRAARSSSPRVSLERVPTPAGRSAPASARRWKG